MADGFQGGMVGANELIQSLRAFREDVAISTVKTSIARIGRYVLQRLQHATPTFTGNLRFNLRTLAKYVRNRGVVVAKVIVNTRGKKGNAKNAFYWRFVEFDRKTRPAKKGGGQRQRTVPGQGFIQATMASVQSVILQMFLSDLKRAIQRAERRNRRRGGLLSR